MTSLIAMFSHPLRAMARSLLNKMERVGWRDRTDTLVREADRYWNGPSDIHWQLNSHWRDAFPGNWHDIGRESLNITSRLARTIDAGLPSGRTVEWGAGGGANAVHFAPLSHEFVAVDVVKSSLDECARQVRMVCETPVTGVLVPLDSPETAVARLGEASCDLFICFYVMELVPSPEYGLRLLSVASRLLREGGVAVIQIKYSNSDPLSRPRRRRYRRRIADMTTYAIDEFWSEAASRGLAPQVAHLVPENQLDHRYAYFLMTRELS